VPGIEERFGQATKGHWPTPNLWFLNGPPLTSRYMAQLKENISKDRLRDEIRAIKETPNVLKWRIDSMKKFIDSLKDISMDMDFSLLEEIFSIL